jgi:hypothetical protein
MIGSGQRSGGFPLAASWVRIGRVGRGSFGDGLPHPVLPGGHSIRMGHEPIQKSIGIIVLPSCASGCLGSWLTAQVSSSGVDFIGCSLGNRFQVNDVPLVHAVAVAEILARQSFIMKERVLRRVWAVGEQRRVALVLSPLPAPCRSPPPTARASGETRADVSAVVNGKNFTRCSRWPQVSLYCETPGCRRNSHSVMPTFRCRVFGLHLFTASSSDAGKVSVQGLKAGGA